MAEADFRVLSVTLNTINTPLGTTSRLQDRNALYPSFGYLYPDGTDRIRKAWNDVTVRAALEPFPVRFVNVVSVIRIHTCQNNCHLI